MRTSQKGGVWPFGEDQMNTFGIPTDTGVNVGVVQYLYYFIIILLVFLLLLVFVNYTITPIFKTRPGGNGVIPLPGIDDSSLYWKKSTDLVTINDTTTPIATKSQNYSFLLDVQLDDPTANTQFPRVIFARGGPNPQTLSTAYTDSSTILQVNANFNVIVYFDRLTNDLHVTVQTNAPSANTNQTLLETVTIQNIPARKAFRLGVMVGEKVVEVYVNGYLVKSKAFAGTTKAVTGGLQPPSDAILSRTAQVSNLRVWGRPLSPSEFRAYGAAASAGFSTKDIPDTCSA
jgi:hypothetical protein